MKKGPWKLAFDTLGRLTLKTNKQAGDGTTTVNSYAYTLDNADQRTRTTFADGRYWDYTYDDAGQLTDAVLKSQANTVLGVHGYQYDPMGNPLSREENGQVRTYTFNELNQFNAATATRPSTTDVRGQVGPDQADPSVTVQGEEDENPVAATVEADGSFVREDVPLVEGANAIAVNVTDKYGRTTSDVCNVTLAAAPTFSYDANGSLTGDGLWDFTWNQENRLVEAVYNVGASAAWRKVQYSYDGLGRRRTKLVYSWDDNTSDWTLDSTTRFVYDGNNLVAELDGNNAILRKYVWGLDLSGTMQGAAGVGGLLAVSDGTNTHFPTYDGNGNITAYLDASDNVVYTAEYSPFGKILSESGTAPCQFGFSTIYRDAETGLLAYRFRDYDPNLGRWLSRDPIGEMGGVLTSGSINQNISNPQIAMEQGGFNLYSMVGNNPSTYFDVLGLLRGPNEIPAIYKTFPSHQLALYRSDREVLCWNISSNLSSIHEGKHTIQVYPTGLSTSVFDQYIEATYIGGDKETQYITIVRPYRVKRSVTPRGAVTLPLWSLASWNAIWTIHDQFGMPFPENIRVDERITITSDYGSWGTTLGSAVTIGFDFTDKHGQVTDMYAAGFWSTKGFINSQQDLIMGDYTATTYNTMYATGTFAGGSMAYFK